MADTAKKGITVKVDAQLHAEVSAYIKEHGMTMSVCPPRKSRHKIRVKNGMKRMAILKQLG